MSDPLTRLLADLPSVEPDAVRAERIRRRCRARIARNAPRMASSTASLKTALLKAASLKAAPLKAAAALWPPLIALLGMAYLAEVVVQALRLHEPR
jgi:hypothetical protein